MKVEHDLVLQQPLPETVGAQQKRVVAGGKRNGCVKLGLDLVVADHPEQLAPALKGRDLRPGMQLAHFDGKLGETVILRVVRENAVMEVVQPAVADVRPYRLIFVEIQRDRRGLHLVCVGAGGEDVPVCLIHPGEDRLAGGQRLIRLPLGKRLDADGGGGFSAAVTSQTVADDGTVPIRPRTEIDAGIFIFRPASDVCIPIPFNYHSCYPLFLR